MSTISIRIGFDSHAFRIFGIGDQRLTALLVPCQWWSLCVCVCVCVCVCLQVLIHKNTINVTITIYTYNVMNENDDNSCVCLCSISCMIVSITFPLISRDRLFHTNWKKDDIFSNNVTSYWSMCWFIVTGMVPVNDLLKVNLNSIMLFAGTMCVCLPVCYFTYLIYLHIFITINQHALQLLLHDHE